MEEMDCNDRKYIGIHWAICEEDIHVHWVTFLWQTARKTNLDSNSQRIWRSETYFTISRKSLLELSFTLFDCIMQHIPVHQTWCDLHIWTRVLTYQSSLWCPKHRTLGPNSCQKLFKQIDKVNSNVPVHVMSNFWTIFSCLIYVRVVYKGCNSSILVTYKISACGLCVTPRHVGKAQNLLAYSCGVWHSKWTLPGVLWRPVN